MNPPAFTLDTIKFATDKPTLQKAMKLYEAGKVTQVTADFRAYTAVVQGTKPYQVSVETRGYDYGHCTCYLGENDTLCKHMVALALYAVKQGQPLTDADKQIVHHPVCSGTLGTLSADELLETKKTISFCLRYIKSYDGPSRTWFAYQNSLDEGCNRLSAVVSELPVSEQTAVLLVNLLLRLDRKLSQGGVDDSNGTVGDFMVEVVDVLLEFVKLDPRCAKAFEKLCNRSTCFGWEEPLVEYLGKVDGLI